MKRFCKMAIFYVVICLSKNFPWESQNDAVMISTIRPAEGDDLEASHTILQIDHLLGSNCVK